VLSRWSVAPPRRSGPTVVIVAGIALSGRYLLPVAGELARWFPVVVPDPPGFGASEAPVRRLEVATLATLFVEWMEQAGIARAALVGNSFGCQVATEVAVRHPARVSHLVLQGPTVDPAARGLVRQALRLARNGPHEATSLAPIQALDWLRTGLPRALGTSQAMVRDRHEERLPLVRCPTLVVRGGRDPIVPQQWAETVADLVPGACLRVVPGASHTMPYSFPIELARLVRAFVDPSTLGPRPQDHGP
jgi:2-hydroxy-6-oxonona-2,4-dienedioate hydrolase